MMSFSAAKLESSTSKCCWCVFPSRKTPALEFVQEQMFSFNSKGRKEQNTKSSWMDGCSKHLCLTVKAKIFPKHWSLREQHLTVCRQQDENDAHCTRTWSLTGFSTTITDNCVDWNAKNTPGGNVSILPGDMILKYFYVRKMHKYEYSERHLCCPTYLEILLISLWFMVLRTEESPTLLRIHNSMPMRV